MGGRVSLWGCRTPAPGPAALCPWNHRGARPWPPPPRPALYQPHGRREVGAAVPVCVFMCSSKYCFMLKSLPHHWHMNCLCPMWMLMCDRSWYLYWKRSLQF